MFDAGVDGGVNAVVGVECENVVAQCGLCRMMVSLMVWLLVLVCV